MLLSLSAPMLVWCCSSIYNSVPALNQYCIRLILCLLVHGTIIICPNTGLLLARRLRRWPSIKTTLHNLACIGAYFHAYLVQCWFDVVPLSTTLVLCLTSIVSSYLVFIGACHLALIITSTPSTISLLTASRQWPMLA